MSLFLPFTNSIFLPFLTSFLISLGATALVIRFSKHLGILDYPGKRDHPAKLHIAPVPRGGGIPIFTALVLGSFFFLPWGPTTAILLGALLLVFIGILDDRRAISPAVRFVFNVAASLAVVSGGVIINFVTNPFGGIIDLTQLSFLPFLPILVTIVWLVFMTNIVSWSSGVDGQLSGFVPIAAAVIGALSLRFAQDLTQVPVALLSAIIAGSFLGLLYFSSYPQRIMPGYSGGALGGFLLGVLSILSGAKVATAIIVLGLPVMDALFVIARRIVTGHSPFLPDAGHFHHRLLGAGLTRAQIAILYWFLSAMLGLLVLHLNSQAKFYTILMIGALLGGVIVWLSFWKSSNRQGRRTG